MLRIGLVIAFVLVAGCAHDDGAAAPEQMTNTMFVTRYAPESRSDRLSEGEQEELFKAVGERVRPGRVWMVNVEYNKGGIFAGEVYFEPDQSSERVRRGYCIHVEGWSDLLAAVKEGPYESSGRYAQVALAVDVVHGFGKGFGGGLPFLEEQMPFEPGRAFYGRGVELGDEELADVVDAARRVLWERGMGRIVGMEMRDGAIRVYGRWAGWGPVPLVGGVFVDVSRKGEKYEVSAEGRWE